MAESVYFIFEKVYNKGGPVRFIASPGKRLYPYSGLQDWEKEWLRVAAGVHSLPSSNLVWDPGQQEYSQS